MKRALFLVPLLALAPLGHFLGSYYGTDWIVGLLGVASMFLLPWVVAALFLVFVKVAWPVRIFLFIGALVVQGFLLLEVCPAGATAGMMGTAHRLRREFPPDEMRDCAAQLRQKHRDGTLAVRQRDGGHSLLMSERAVIVQDSELPVALRGRFKSVYIEPDTGEERVFFSFSERSGIVCDSRKSVRGFFECSMADGVHVYAYSRL
jgi:hypothetical protein